jgi:hypothetical protein
MCVVTSVLFITSLFIFYFSGCISITQFNAMQLFIYLFIYLFIHSVNDMADSVIISITM